MLCLYHSHMMTSWPGNASRIAGSLTHWGLVTHICVGNLTIIGSDNGLSPDRRQAINWTNAGILLNGPLRTNFSVILIEIVKLSFKKRRLKVSSAKWLPFCLGLNVLKGIVTVTCGLPSQMVTSDSPYQGRVMWNFILFHVSLIKLLNKYSGCRWSETPWRFCDVIGMS